MICFNGFKPQRSQGPQGQWTRPAGKSAEIPVFPANLPVKKPGNDRLKDWVIKNDI